MNIEARYNAVWECKIGLIGVTTLPNGADAPMREAVSKAFREVTGQDRGFLFSGWGGELNPIELAIAENKPIPEHACESLESQINRLANFIMAEIDGEPSKSEGAVDTAIRWMREQLSCTAVRP